MSTALLIAFIILAAAGAALAVLGIRGRRIDDHPVCRRCRFDLHGVYPGVGACPECGAALLHAGSIRRGQRRPRRGVLVVGALLVGLGGVSAGLSIWGRASGFNWNTVKPGWLLVWEATRAVAPDVAVLHELSARMAAAELREGDVSALGQHAARRQSEPGWTWHPAFAEAFTAAWERGLIDNDDALRYAKAVDPPTLSLEAMGPEGGWPHMLTVQAAYAGSVVGGPSSVLTVDYTLEELRFANGPGRYRRVTIAAEYNRSGVPNAVYGQVVGPTKPEGPLVATWRARAVSRTGSRAGETIGEWTFTTTTDFEFLAAAESGARDGDSTASPP